MSNCRDFIFHLESQLENMTECKRMSESTFLLGIIILLRATVRILSAETQSTVFDGS